MLKKLRLQLTLLTSILTGLIVLAVCTFSYYFAKDLYIQSNIATFQSAVTDIITQWTQSNIIDLNWPGQSHKNCA